VTEDALLDRVRTVLVAEGFTEAPAQTFDRQPGLAIDAAFAVAYAGTTPKGGTGYTEEARGVVTIQIARLVNNDFAQARRTALQDVRTVLSALVQDGAVTSGEYAVEDAGRAVDIEAPRGASYLLARCRVPVNFETTLT
jgi:hypothetical protein